MPNTVRGDNDDMWGLDMDRIEEYEAEQYEILQDSKRLRDRERYQRKKQHQHRRWIEDVIPLVQPLYHRWIRETESGRGATPVSLIEELEERTCTCGGSRRHHIVVCRWDRAYASLG